MSNVTDPFEPFFKNPKYRERLQQMSLAGSRSLYVDFVDLYEFNHELARKVLQEPDTYLERLANAAFHQLGIEAATYADTLEKVDVRITRLLGDALSLRRLGADNLNRFVMIEAIVVRASPVQPLLTKAAYKCKSCGTMNFINQPAGPFMKSAYTCKDETCRQHFFEFHPDASEFTDSQDLRVQERPEDLPAGQLPRTLYVKIVGKEIVDIARPGDHVNIVGIARAFPTINLGNRKLRTFLLQLDANSIEVLGKEPEFAAPSVEEEKQILEFAKDPWVHRKILQSIAPSIFGYEHIKEAAAYLLFGGCTKHLPDMTIRGELNMLIVGDPGIAKTQILLYVASVAPRGLYTSGRGTTAAGLTAAVVRERNGGMTLEAGAMVLADKGVLCIDEMDKMKPDDRVAIHEAMEQHTVSVAKGGIIAKLNARTSTLAAANPSLGRYEPHRTVAENIGSLPITLLSRFDLIFVLRDVPDKERDDQMSSHILKLHSLRNSPKEPPVRSEFLRKYIAYSKQIEPKWTPEAQESLRRFYLEMRKASESEGSPVAITARQLESLVRIAEARARLALHETVDITDAEAAINLMKQSLEEVGIDVTSYQLDIDLIMTGKPKSLRDKVAVVVSAVMEMEHEVPFVEKEALLADLQTKHQIPREEAKQLISQLLKDGTFFEPRDGFLKKT